MNDEKPFKTIEVVDSRTNQVCKVACMSCIRGHRTTSCGIPVCRTKVFWTVKRPGRPSNSCTCRYGASGGCKCVVARSACPHKSKKGEKRSGECRCDEQGRYCCLLEPEHWIALLSLQNPSVDFFSSRDALEYKQTTSMHGADCRPPAYASAASPTTTHSMPGTPAPLNGRMQPVPILPNNFNAFQPMQTTITPRFGMMGIGGPLGSPTHASPDLLVWEGHASIAPREYPPPSQAHDVPRSERGSCCQSATPSAPSAQSPSVPHAFSPLQPLQDLHLPQSYDEIPPHTTSWSQVSSAAPTVAPAYDFNKFQMDYFNYQFPSSICQNCGLNGCTCRNCPPVFQNFGTTSWAQCCGRKHARDAQPASQPQSKKLARTETYKPAQSRHAQSSNEEMPAAKSIVNDPAFEPNDLHFSDDLKETGIIQPTDHPPDFTTFDLDQTLILPDGTEFGDLSEFLVSDLDTSDQVGNEGIDRGGQGDGDIAVARGTDRGEEDDDGGGGGCCCGG